MKRRPFLCYEPLSLSALPLLARLPRYAGAIRLTGRRLYVALAISLYVLINALIFLRALRADLPAGYVLTALSIAAPIIVYFLLRSALAASFSAYILVMPFDTLSRFGAFGTITKAFGALCAVALIVRLGSRKDPLRAPGVLVVWLALLTWMVLSVAWAPGGDNASVALSQYAALIALFALLCLIPVQRLELMVILASVLVAGVIAGGYDIYLFHHGALTSDQRALMVIGESHIDPNDYAAALMLPIAIALYLLFNSKHAVLRALMIPNVLVLFAGLAASGSRGGFLSVATIFAYLIFKSRHRLKLLGVLVCSVGFAVTANPALVIRFQRAGTDEGAGRGDIWRVGIQAFRDHWLAGWGVGNFPDAYDATHLRVFTRHVHGWDWHPHNTVLLVATELGVVGLALWGTALCMQFNVVATVGKSRNLLELKIALQAAFLAVFVAGLGTSNLNMKYAWLSYAVLVLLRGYVLTRERSQREAVDVAYKRSIVSPIRKRRWPAIRTFNVG